MYDSNNLAKKLELLKEEDFVWIIYIFIIIFAITSNYYERKYLFTKSKLAQKKYRNLNTTVFTIAFFIYLYFVVISFDELKTGDENKFNSFLRLIGALLFLVAGFIYLYADITNYNNEDDEIGFI